MSDANNIVRPELVEDFRMMTPPEEGAVGWIWWALGAALVLALLVPLVLTLRPRREQEAPPDPEPPDPALAARERLRQLRSALADLTPPEAAEETSGILRDYLHGRSEVSAPFLTTSELMRHLRGVDLLPDGTAERIDRLLDACDFFKFAGGRLASGTFAPLVDEAEALVEETTPRKEAPS